MVQIQAVSPADYVKRVPADQRKDIAALRALIRKHLPAGYQEAANWGMLAYQVPLKKCPNTYNGQPLVYLGLAAQKNHIAIYFMGLYGDEKLKKKFEADYKKSGKKFNMGKSCLRFKKIEDIPLDVITAAISALEVDEFIELHNAAMSMRKSKRLKTNQ